MTAAERYQSVNLPLAQLKPSKQNVRKSKPSQESHAQLVAGIQSVGLLTPLIVIPSDTKDVFEVIAGKRRLKALQELVKKGHFDEDAKFQCNLLRADDVNAEEISLIENTQRVSMHPADEFEAMHKLKKSGMSAEEIAVRHGTSTSNVYKLLKLGGVAPVILRAFRNDEINLHEAEAFTVCDDKGKQAEVFESLKQRNELWARAIRDELTGNAPTDRDKIARYVGQAAYEKAGGTLSTDLFQEMVYFHDAELLKNLANAKLEKAAKRIKGEWNWIEIAIDGDALSYKKLTPRDTEETAPLRAKLDDIDSKLRTLEETPEEDWNDDNQAHYERLESEAEKIEEQIEKSQQLHPEEMAIAGCLVCVNHSGKTEIHRGLLRHQDLNKLKALQGKKETDPGSSTTTPVAAEDASKMSNALIEDLTCYRLNIVKSYLAQHPTLARALMDYSLCKGVLYTGYYDEPLHLRTEFTRPHTMLAKPDTNRCIDRLADIHESLRLEWLSAASEAESFDAFCALSQDERDELVAYCTAQIVNMDRIDSIDVTDSPIESVIPRLEIPWHSEFKPTADNFFGRVNKDTLIEIGSPWFDEEWAEAANKRSKKLLAEDLEMICAGEDSSMPAEKRAQAVDWYPPILDAGVSS